MLLPRFNPLPAVCGTFADQPHFDTAACVRAQIARILALPSLLGIAPCIDTQEPSLPVDIDGDNATPAHSDREGCHAVTDLRPVHPPSMPEVNPFLPVSFTQTQHQLSVWQHSRHRFHPSDPTPTMINRTDPDHDQSQHHRATSPPIPSRTGSTDEDLLSYPESDDGILSVSCLIAGLYTRCSVFDLAGGNMCAGGWGPASVEYVRYVQRVPLRRVRLFVCHSG